MTTLEKNIQQYYIDFNKDFNKKNFPAVFEKIDEHNAKEKRGKEHDLGSFAILYTPVRYKLFTKKDLREANHMGSLFT